MPERPRIALVPGDLAPGELARAVAAASSEADFLFVGAGPQGLPRIERGRELGPILAEARAEGKAGALVPGDGETALAAAVELARSGQIDALAGALAVRPDETDLLARLAGVSREKTATILFRAERIVVPLDGADEGRARAAIELVSELLPRELALSRPRLVVCASSDESSPEERAISQAVSLARSRGADVRGPLPADEAFSSQASAVFTRTSDQARLGLLLSGSGPTARLLLGLPFVRASEDPHEATAGRAAREASLRASVLLAARSARARGELAAVRDERAAAERRARATQVAVSARAPRGEDRCPYCRRPFEDGEPEVRCASCETPHHRACIHEHGRCTIHGCGAEVAVRHGVRVKVRGLGGDGDSQNPFHAKNEAEPFQDERGIRWLKVDAAVDDPEERAGRRHVTIQLSEDAVPGGGRVAGAVTIHAPRAFRATGGVLALRSMLETLDAEGERRVQPILEREALLAGRPPRSVLGRISEGFASLLGAGEHVEIPAGVRRYIFSFELDPDHPASVRHARKGQEEIVTTVLEATIFPSGGGALSASKGLTVK
ncbi:4-hydroxythreonine-4-phosphate dehydrogenase PdxA [bacterium]|nr:4-hydroxythreonine-4-phosphate dehydrogenase PdxA [bacterium]